MEITYEELLQYFSGKKKRASYKEAKDNYDILRAHTNGEWPKTLITERRPSETIDIFEYRKKIYEPITMEPMSSIIRSLGKIRRSSDWSIKYDTDKVDAKIATGETLCDYCEYKFPFFTSVTNWAFSILLKNLLIDTNAVLMVMPLNEDAAANEYLKPFPLIYNSDNVYEFKPGELAILLSTEQTDKKGKIFYVVNNGEIQKWEQKGQTADYTLTNQYAYGFDLFPCFRLPGIFVKMYGTNDMLTFSHLQPIVPRLNEASREYSDMQAAIVQFCYPQGWEYATQKCEECLDPTTGVSNGKIKAGNGQKIITCTKCNGTGTMGGSPYKKIVLTPNEKGKAFASEFTVPPAGFIERDIEIMKLQDTRIDDHIFKALSAINMQFLAQTPLSISGEAKGIDRDELNNFVYGIAEDLVKVLDETIAIINEYRYHEILPQQSKRDEQLPVIPVPEKFDLLSTSTLVDELKDIRNSQASPMIILAHEIDYTAKKFYAQPEVKDQLICVMNLDPLPATNDDEKSLRLQVGGITKIDYVISCNILPFVRRAIFEDEDFYTLPLDEQQAVMIVYANEKLDSIAADEAAQMKIQAAAIAATAAAKPPVTPDGN